MSDKKIEESQDLRLHRKYIYVISLLFVFFMWGQVKLSELNLPLTKLEIPNQGSIYGILWILYIYSILRYFQFYWSTARNQMNIRYLEIKKKIYDQRIIKLCINKYPKYDSLSKKDFPRLENFVPKEKGGTVMMSEITKDTPPREKSAIEINFKKQFWSEKAKTIFTFLFKYPEAFNYAFPFLLFISIFIYQGFFKGWPGNLICLIWNCNC